jgi:hypothetical protein
MSSEKKKVKGRKEKKKLFLDEFLTNKLARTYITFASAYFSLHIVQ